MRDREAASVERKRRDFERDVLPHLERLRRYAIGYASDGDEAKDWVQETLMKAYRAWERYEPGTNLGAWLRAILRNTVISEHRSRRRLDTVRFKEIDRFPTLAAPPGPHAGREGLDAPLDGEVVRALDALSPQLRETLVLSDLEGLSYEEIAQLKGVPLGTVQSRLFRARRALRPRLYRYALETGSLPRSARAVARRAARGTSAFGDRVTGGLEGEGFPGLMKGGSVR